MTSPACKVMLFFKARRFKDRPGYALQTHRWHSIAPEGQGGGGGENHVRPKVSKQDVRQWLTHHAANWRELPYTLAHWQAEFGDPPHVVTPLGLIKLGAHQFDKLTERDGGERIRYGGLIRPTLEQPTFIIERHAPQSGAERESKLVFIRGFQELNRGLRAFAAITVRRDGLEIMISAHREDFSRIARWMREDRVGYVVPAISAAIPPGLGDPFSDRGNSSSHPSSLFSITQKPRPLTKSRPLPSGAVVLFFKARRFKDQPGYALQTHRWHSIAPDGQGGGSSAPVNLSPFKPDPVQAEAFRNSLDRAMAHRQSVVAPITVGDTPAVLTALGVPANPIVISRDTVRKATNGVKHNVPLDIITQLPEILADPVMVFDSKTEPGSLVVLSEFEDARHRSVMIALHVSQQRGRLRVNLIGSVYGKDDDRFFAREIAAGRLRYRQTRKSADWIRHRRLYLPRGGSPDQRSSWPEKILTEADLVNPPAPLAKAKACPLPPGAVVLVFLKPKVSKGSPR